MSAKIIPSYIDINIENSTSHEMLISTPTDTFIAFALFLYTYESRFNFIMAQVAHDLLQVLIFTI